MMEVGKFLMLGIITADAEKSVAQFEEMGFHGWTTDVFDSDHIPNVLVDGEPGHFSFIGCTYRSDTINIELLQPTSESIFMDFLREHGPGVHHMEFEPKANYASFLEEYKAKGHNVAMEVDMAGGVAGFAYLDTMDLLGFMLEIHK